jgi:hypothetical protein
MGSSAAKNNCQLEKIKEIEECKGSKKSKYFATKIEYLKKNFPENKNTPFHKENIKDNSLYEIMAGKFYSDLGLKAKSSLSCPLDINNNYALSGQLDKQSADDIFEYITTNKEVILKNAFNDYPQLKIIKDTDNKEFIDKFKNFVKNKPTKMDSNEYISSFFLDEKNRKIISESISDKCKNINQNLEKFLCSDLKELGTQKNETSEQLFEGLQTDVSLDEQFLDLDKPEILTAYGMNCLEKDRISKDKNNSNSLDDWLQNFTKKTRLYENNLTKEKQNTENFCKSYECKSVESKVTNSCKKGGPISSLDLKRIYNCLPEQKTDSCKSQNLKEIKYLESIEKLITGMKDDSLNTSNSNIINSNKKGSLPAFAENFFGAEGTLKALGKTPTPQMIAEKSKDIEESIFKPASLQSSVTAPPIQEVQTTQHTQAQPAPTQSADTSAEIKADFTPTQRTYASAVTAKSSSTRTDSSNKIVKVMPDTSDAKESSRLRKDMEDMLKGLKEGAVADTEGTSPTNPSNSANNDKKLNSLPSTTSASTRAEEERLRRVARGLDDRAEALDDYKRELDKRSYDRSASQDEAAPKSQNVKASNPLADNSGSNSQGSSSGGSSSSGSSALKLTAANAKGEQKINTAAIIQSGKETSTLSVEELAKLSPDNLKTLGIDSSKPFVLRVNFKEKTYEVPVKSLLYKGNNILGPVIDPKNKDLKELLMKSPLFKPYREYRMERESLIDL